ncbi:hypothetical protein RSAG8_12026, partial [Rhizoctonia solani AG-8 WAC10335]
MTNISGTQASTPTLLSNKDSLHSKCYT